MVLTLCGNRYGIRLEFYLTPSQEKKLEIGPKNFRVMCNKQNFTNFGYFMEGKISFISCARFYEYFGAANFITVYRLSYKITIDRYIKRTHHFSRLIFHVGPCLSDYASYYKKSSLSQYKTWFRKKLRKSWVFLVELFWVLK